MLEDWTIYSWYCPNCKTQVAGLKNKKNQIRVICTKCGVEMVRTVVGRRHDVIDMYAPSGMLGCTDDVTADYISDRSGEMCIVVNSTMTVKKTVAVAQVIPQYRETQGQLWILALAIFLAALCRSAAKVRTPS